MTHQALFGEHYKVTVADLNSPVQTVESLNRILHRLQERLDQLEGVRGTATIQAPLEIRDADGNLIHGMTENTE